MRGGIEMLSLTRRLVGQLGLVGVMVAVAMIAMALLAKSAEAHHGDFYASADCYGWEVGATYVGDEDRRVDVDVTVNDEHIVSSDTGYHEGDTLFERTGIGSVDATGKIKVYVKEHREWELESKRKLDFHFDFAPCQPETPPETPTETPPVTPPETPPETPAETPPGISIVTPPGAGSEVLAVVAGPREFPAGGSQPSGDGSSELGYLALLSAGLALIAGVGVISVAAARSRRR
jgi:hypothetical protein